MVTLIETGLSQAQNGVIFYQYKSLKRTWMELLCTLVHILLSDELIRCEQVEKRANTCAAFFYVLLFSHPCLAIIQ